MKSKSTKNFLAKTLLTFLLITGLPALAFADKDKKGSRIVVDVMGMVCAFCAGGIEETFMKEDAVEKITVSLEKHQITLNLKEGKTLDDERIKQLITDASYNISQITRE